MNRKYLQISMLALLVLSVSIADLYAKKDSYVLNSLTVDQQKTLKAGVNYECKLLGAKCDKVPTCETINDCVAGVMKCAEDLQDEFCCQTTNLDTCDYDRAIACTPRVMLNGICGGGKRCGYDTAGYGACTIADLPWPYLHQCH